MRSNEAIHTAAWLARSTDVTIRAVSTFRRPWTAFSKLGGKYNKWRKKESAACARAVEAAFEDADIPREAWDDTVSVFADGTSEALLVQEAALDFDADVVLLGSGAAAPKGTFLAGSTTDALLHSSPISLMLAPKSVKLSKKGISRINFAFLDGGPMSDVAAMLMAAQLANKLDLPLRILSFTPSGLMDATMNSKLDLTNEFSAESHEQTLALLDRAADVVHDRFPDMPVETDLGSGRGWGGAVDALKWKKGDLLALSSNPPSPIERVFIGSSTTEFLRYVTTPVLIYPHRPGHHGVRIDGAAEASAS